MNRKKIIWATTVFFAAYSLGLLVFTRQSSFEFARTFLFKYNQEGNNHVFLDERNLTESLQQFYQGYVCTYDTPVYVVYERGDTSKFILYSFNLLWTFYSQFLEDHNNRTYVVFS